MKTIKQETLHKCDFCKIEDAAYDAPTIYGNWANMCKNCYHKYKGQLADIAGYNIVKREPKVESRCTKIKYAKELGVSIDGDREIMCPDCGETKSVELDACGTTTCEGCGVQLRLSAWI